MAAAGALLWLAGSVRAQVLADRFRWALWLPFALGVGDAGYFALQTEPGTGWAVAALGLTLVTIFAAAVSHVPLLRMTCALLAAVSLGFATAKLRTESVRAPVLASQIGPVGLDGRLESVQQHGKRARLVLSHIALPRLAPDHIPARVRVSLRAQTSTLMPGQWVHLMVVLMPPPEPSVPGANDFGREAYFLRIGAVGYAYGGAQPISPRAADGIADRVSLAIAILRWRITQRIHAVLPGSTGGIASALITGDRGAISPEDEQALRDAGLAHVLAIAGLHMALVGLGLFWTVRALLALFPILALRYPIKKWAALAALGGAGFYLVISGAATPATRAFIMLAAMLLAILFDRPALSMRSVALAATLILLSRPENIFEPGFQMSFAAVGSLVAIAEWEQRQRARRTEPVAPSAFAGLKRYIHGIAITSFVGSLATAPYAIFHFDRATHYAVIGNLLAMPVMGFLAMPAAALSVMLMPFGLDYWPLRLLGRGIEVMLALGGFVSALPGAVSVMPAWPDYALVLLSFGGVWVLIWRQSWRWLGLVPLGLGLGLALTAEPPDLLVARDGRTVAVRLSSGLAFIGSPSDRYAAENWLRRAGDERLPAQAIGGKGMACDSFGCVARVRGVRIAVDVRAEALAEDCATADIVVSSSDAHGFCAGPKLVIDRHDLLTNGAYAVRFSQPWTVETVVQQRGQRPWSVTQ